MVRSCMRHLSLIVCCLFTLPLSAADGLSALEYFAWAEDRATAVERFLPGSDQHWYYRCLLAQHRGDLAEVDRLIAAWAAARTGNPPESLATMRLRQAALKVDTTGAAGLKALAEEMGLSFDHPAPAGAEGAPDQVGRVDTSGWTWEAIRRRALEEPKAFQQLTTAGLARILPDLAHPAQRRTALERLTDPTIPGLEAAVIADLATEDTRPFLSSPVHRYLTEAQLDRIAAAVPRLASDTVYLEQRLRRLVARHGEAWKRDDAARQAYLEDLARFLPASPAAGAIGELALAHLLADARADGRWDQALFERWVAAHCRRRPDEPRLDDETVARLTGLGQPPERLLDDQLDHWLARAPDGALAIPLLGGPAARTRFIAAKVLAGVGDVADWYRQLGDTRAAEELQRRRELQLVPGHRRHWKPGTTPALRCTVKRLDSLTVRIWRLDEEAALRAGHASDDIPDCSGLQPTAIITQPCTQPEHLRHEQVIALIACAAPGAYVVDLSGADQGLRAFIEVGGLHAAGTPTADGLEVAVVDDAGQAVPGAILNVGGQRHEADRAGQVILPFSSTDTATSVVVSGNGRAVRTSLVLPAEQYQLACRLMARQEQFLAGTTATLVLRSVLTCHGDVLPVARLIEPLATITWKDDGDQTIAVDTLPITLRDDGDALFTLRTPERAALVSVELRGRVRNRTAIADQDLKASHQLRIASRSADHSSITSWLLRQDGERYLLQARGRAGEALPRRTATLTAHHALGGTEPVVVRTDDTGTIACGPLTDITQLTLSEGADRPWQWSLRHPDATGPAVTLATNQTWICVATARPVVLRHRDNRPLAVLPDACTAREGFWEIGPLPAGSYRVITDGNSQELLVLDGQPIGRHLATPGLMAERQNLPPVCRAQITGDELVIHVRQISKATRIHCLAAHVLADAPRAIDPLLTFPRPTVSSWDPDYAHFVQRTLGSEERYILDRQGLPRLPGMMLDRPGPLLDPVAPTKAELANEDPGTAGMYGSRAGGGNRQAVMRSGGSRSSRERLAVSALPWLDFLAAPPAVIANLIPDAQGMIRVPLARFGGASLVEVLVCDGLATTQDRVALPMRALPVRERRLVAAFDPAQPLSVRMELKALTAGNTLDVPAHAIAGLRLVDSVTALIDLLTATHGDDALTAWREVGRWQNLDAEARSRLYDRLASHELHLFLARRDPAWCAQHLKPYLMDKLQPTLVDRWITGGDLTPFTRADHFTELNAVERVLLAWGLPAAADQERRWLREQVDRATPDAQGLTRFIEAALATVPNGPRGALFLAVPAGGAGGDASLIGSVEDAQQARLRDLPGVPTARETMDASVDQPARAAAPALAGKERERAVVPLKPATPTRRFYRMPGEPKVLKEATWYRSDSNNRAAWLIRPTTLWADLAAHDPSKPFLPIRGLDTLDNHHALLAALAFIDLPFVAQPPRWTDIPGGRRLTAAGPSLAVMRSLTPLPAREDGITMRQRLVEVSNDKNPSAQQPISDGRCRPRTVYVQELVVVNTNPDARLVQILVQIPAGAVALDGPDTRCETVHLDAFAQVTTRLIFYWPEAGERRQCALSVNDATHRLATLPPITWTVRDDTAGGPWTSLTDRAAFLRHLRSEELEHADLDDADWMMSDAACWREAIAILRERRQFKPSWWKYALFHGDLLAAAELLRSNSGELGPVFASRWLNCDVLDDGKLELLDVAPLVNARAHRHPDSGDGTVKTYYDQLCRRLAHRAVLDDRDRYTLVCVLLLQDRLAEAITQHARIDAKATAGRLPWDHARAWLALAKGDLDTAQTIAARHRDHPVGHWRDRFAELSAQLDEIAGREADRHGDAAERRALERQATAEPALRLERADAGHLAISGRHLKSCTVRWRGVDLETLFSRTPFGLAADTGDLSLVAPALEQNLPLDAAGGARLPIPAAWRGKTAVVEAVGAEARATLLVADDDLDVVVSAGSGLVQVRTRDGKPVAAAYVKVYRRHDGKAIFHKDGYTDRRGRFDHAALNGTALPAMDRLALYIEAEGHGAVVREVEPPQQ